MLRTHDPLALAYTVAGAGPPVLLVMGLGMRGRVWGPVADRMRGANQVATYDHPGVGDSAGTSPPAEMTGLVAGAVAVADALGWPTLHLVGVSMGGMVAAQLALAYPDRVRSLALIATHGGGPFAWVPPLRSLPLLAGVAALPAPVAARLRERLLHPAGALRGFDSAQRASRRRDATLAPRRVLRAQLRAVRGHDVRARLGAIRCPTLVVQPLQDRLCRPAHSERLAAAIPGARLLSLDAGHGLVFHAAEVLAQALLAHVDAAEAQAGSS